MAADVAVPERARVMGRELDRARDELEEALAELSLATRNLVTFRHWRLVAERSFRKRPVLFLGVAFAIGCGLGRPRRR